MVRKLIAIVLSLLILTWNLVFSNEEDIDKIQQKAKHDAEKDIDRTEWIASGCITLAIAVGTSQAYSPDPSPERFIGKSSEYTEYYCQAYEVEIKELQLKYAKIGCCAGMILWPATLLTIIAIAAANYTPP